MTYRRSASPDDASGPRSASFERRPFEAGNTHAHEQLARTSVIRRADGVRAIGHRIPGDVPLPAPPPGPCGVSGSASGSPCGTAYVKLLSVGRSLDGARRHVDWRRARQSVFHGRRGSRARTSHDHAFVSRTARAQLLITENPSAASPPTGHVAAQRRAAQGSRSTWTWSCRWGGVRRYAARRRTSAVVGRYIAHGGPAGRPSSRVPMIGTVDPQAGVSAPGDVMTDNERIVGYDRSPVDLLRTIVFALAALLLAGFARWAATSSSTWKATSSGCSTSSPRLANGSCRASCRSASHS